MTDEKTKRIEVTAGPMSGMHVDVPEGDADDAIARGFARDPFAPLPQPGEQVEPPKEFSDEERAELVAAAERAARKWRGEKDEDHDDESHAKGGKGKEAGHGGGKSPAAATRATSGASPESDDPHRRETRTMTHDPSGTGKYPTR